MIPDAKDQTAGARKMSHEREEIGSPYQYHCPVCLEIPLPGERGRRCINVHTATFFAGECLNLHVTQGGDASRQCRRISCALRCTASPLHILFTSRGMILSLSMSKHPALSSLLRPHPDDLAGVVI